LKGDDFCIAVDASSLLTDRPRGEGRSLLRLYEEIAKLRPRWRIVLFGTRAAGSASEIRARIPNCSIRTLEVPGYRWNLWENVGLPMLAWLSGADLLHCASSGTPFWSPVPVVMTVHDVIPLIMDDGGDSHTVQRFKTRLFAGVRLAKRVIAVSDNTRLDLAKTTNVDPAAIEVVHWGADQLPVCGHTVSRSSKIVLGFGGGGATRKNLPAVLQMFAMVVRKVPDARLIIVGATNKVECAQLEKRLFDLAIQDRVELRGYVPDSELATLYAEASCLVYLSLYEGFGLPPLEAMVHGIPVVASNRSSIPEVVADAGLLVDPENAREAADAVLRLLENASLRQRLSNAAVERATLFSWRRAAEETVAIFEEVLNHQH
jgi:glycosyltransferase involved in cell wall biosynthesis